MTALVDVNAGSCHITPELRDLRVREVIDAGHLAIAAGPLNARHAIFAIDLRDDSRDVLLDADRIARELPTQLALPAEQIGFDHPLLSADGDWLFVKIMAHVAGARRFHSVVLYHRGTDQLHVHGAEISGHPVWHPRDPVIYNIRQTRDGADNRHIVAVDPASGDFTRVLETPIEGPGHLSFSPDGRWLITDAFCADQRTCPIYAIDMRSRTCRELMRLRHHSELGNYHSFWRGQPHPAFSPSGRQFAFNCNAGTDTMSIWIAAAPEPSDSEAQA